MLDILLIEDSQGDAFLIRELLFNSSKETYTIHHIDRLSDVTQATESRTFSLICLDLGLPDSFGVETLRSVRRLVPDIPVVVLTGNEDEEVAIQSMKAGAQDYILKGNISTEILERVFRYAIERQEGQKNLRKSAQFLQNTVDALSAHIAIIDETGKILSVNKAWRLFARENGGPQATSCEGANYFDACYRSAEDGDNSGIRFADGMKEVLRGNLHIFEMEYSCHNDTEEKWFHGRVTPFHGEDFPCLVVAHENITSRKQAEIARKLVKDALRESEEQLRLIFDTTPNFVFITNNEGQFISVNKAMTVFFGLSQEELLGKTEQELPLMTNRHQTDNQAKVNSTSETSLTHQEIIKTEEPKYSTDGTVHWFRTLRTPINLPSTPNCSLGISIDITEQRAAELKTRNSEERLQTIFNNLTSKVVLLDKDLRVLWANRYTSDLTGKNQNELTGLNCSDLWSNPETIKADQLLNTALSTGEVQLTTVKDDDGQTWRILGCPIRDDTGGIINVVEVSENITDFITLENTLREAQKIESLGTLAGGVAHDFNNILTAIIGFTELCLARTLSDEGLRDDLNEVFSAGQRAKELVSQILTFSRRGEVANAPLHMPFIIKEALKLLRSTLPTTVDIKTSIEKDVGYILADPTQIHQVVMNLCTNASHAMEPHGGTLTITLSKTSLEEEECRTNPHLTHGQYVELYVADTGCGMFPEIKRSIFDPYFTTKELGEGTGLGLAVTLGIVRESGGDIIVESEPGKGSIFRSYFPVVNNPVQRSEIQKIPKDLDGKGTILLVDDEAQVVKLLSRYLNNAGFTVQATSSSVKALETFIATPDIFDLVLSDVTMPKLSGDLLVRDILKIRNDIPIILMTGYNKSINEDSIEKLQVQALLTKPIEREQLIRTVNSLLNEQ